MVSLLHIKRDFKDWQRLREIATAFAMGGFSYYIKRAKLRSCISIKCRIHCFFKRKCDCASGKHSLPIHFRKILENLGPTFVKFGQLLSLRPDVIPEEYCQELRKLQDEVPPFKFSEIQKIIENEFHKPLSKLFLSFDKKSLAAASIAQAHKAKLRNGKVVAVKVMRPRVMEVMQQDLRLLENIAVLLEKHYKESRPFRPKQFVQEFKEWTMKELDFRNEALVMDEMRFLLKDNKTVKIPKVYWKQTTKNVLTMEFIKGCHIDDGAGLKKLHSNRKQLAINSIRLITEQTLVHGVFHGDPHPGNIFVLPKNQIALIDFGIIGRLTNKQKRKLSLYLIHLFEHDFERATDSILDLIESTKNSDIEGYKRKVMDILTVCHGSLEQNSLTEALFRCVIAGVEYRIHFPSDLVLLSKAFVTGDSVGRQLYPKFTVMTDAKEPVLSTLKKNLLPTKTISNLIKNSLDYTEIIEELPLHASRILKIIENGEISINIDNREFSNYLKELHKTYFIKALAAIIAALIITSGITSFLSGEMPKHMFQIPMLELYAAFVLGIILFFQLKKNKR